MNKLQSLVSWYYLFLVSVIIMIIFAGGPGPLFPLPLDSLQAGFFTYKITAISPGGQVAISEVAFAIPGWFFFTM